MAIAGHEGKLRLRFAFAVSVPSGLPRRVAPRHDELKWP
jgi:hypothetical protein